MAFSLVDIDDLKISSAVLPVDIQILIAVKGNPAAAVHQKRKGYIIKIKVLVIEIC